MSNNKVWDSVNIFQTGMCAADWAWRITTVLFIGGSGTITAFVAKADPVLKELGAIYWVSIGVLVSLIISAILYFVKSANLKEAQANFNRVMATPKNTINPLSDSFKDSIISIEDLKLPIQQLHENKHFKRCKFVGPAAIAIIGGNYVNSGFTECGDLIALPDNVLLTGIIVFKNCTVEECQFIRTTVFTDQNTARGFLAVPGASVKGINK